ncbi:hypothetical protein GN244_ATG01117 [Phytophthora infestans]|uniref:Uncharacterized protein n=1 Tax=Phytophthora infestans TaxID=4787 RepID=A0A833SVY2_PHYIN|nr:hypothetical protein GN244_ATG01117 [Phytophthora infestans]
MADVVGSDTRQSASPASTHKPQRQQMTNHDNDRITYAKTWAEDVQNYRAAKSVLPWQPGQQQPVKYVTRYEKSREEREYDALLGRFRSEDKEMGLQQRESTELKRNLEKGRAKQLRTIQRFNMISNEPMYPGAKDPTDKQPVAHPNRKNSAADYNIVTNFPHNGTSASPPATGSSPSHKPHREFNILTNKYFDRHDARFNKEAAEAKRIAAQKYFKTRTFDPIRITFLDEEREKEFLKRRQEQQQVHGKDRVLVLPPREQFSEGRVYNILNQQVINPNKLATINNKDQRTLNKIKKTAFETKMREVGETQRARDTDLQLNRFAHERHTESHVHGYDVLSNQPYAGRDAKPLAHPRTHAALTPWQTIESGLLVSNRVASIAPSTSHVRCDNQTDAAKTNILIVEKSPGTAQGLGQSPSTSTQGRIRTGGFGGEQLG